MSRIRFNVRGYIDRRSPQLLGMGRAIEQELADQRLEREWRARVARNVEARKAAQRAAVVIPLYRPPVRRVG